MSDKARLNTRMDVGSLAPPLSWVFRDSVGKSGQGQLRENVESLIRRRAGLALFAKCEEHIISFLIEELIVRKPPALTNQALVWKAICNEIIDFLRKELGRKRPPERVKALGPNAEKIWRWKTLNALDDALIVAHARSQLQMQESEVRAALVVIAANPPRPRLGQIQSAIGTENDEAVAVDGETPELTLEKIQEIEQLCQLEWLMSDFSEKAAPALLAVRCNPKHQLAFLAVQLHFHEGKSISAVAKMLHNTDYKIKNALNDLYDDLRPLLGLTAD